VLAAGAWSGLVASLAGIEVPVHPERRQVAVTHPYEILPARMPMSIDCSDGFHVRVRDGRVLLLWPHEPAGAEPFDLGFDDSWLEGVVARARRRVPSLEAARIDRDACYTGLYEMSPDQHALVGPAPGVEGLHLATGNSGHGVMHAPAIGRLVAEMILDGEARSLDIRALRPSRFLEGDPNPSPGVL
jgi:sarcosine oxidase subunit beta